MAFSWEVQYTILSSFFGCVKKSLTSSTLTSSTLSLTLKKKESNRLLLGSKILKLIGVKNKIEKGDNIRIWGNQNLELKGSYSIKDYMKDHRIMAMATISALTLGGNWKIYDKNSINTSFPDFIKILKNIGAKFVE